MNHPIARSLEERLDIVRIRTKQGQTADEIAVRLDVCKRTIVRYRARLRAAGVLATDREGEARPVAGHNQQRNAA